MTESLDKQPIHQGIPKDNNPTDTYNPTDKEVKAKKLVTKKFDEAKAYRSKYDSRWMDYYQMFRGKQWKEQRPAYRHAEVINFIFQEIQSVVPILTDTQPKVSFLPVEPGDREIADIIEKVYNYDWRRNKWSIELLETIYDAHIYGIGYGSVTGKVMDGKGKIEHGSADPFYCFPDPNSLDVNKKGTYFIYAEPVSLEVAKQENPKHAKYIRADLSNLESKEEEKTNLGKARFQSPTDKKSSIEESNDYSYDPKKENMTLSITLWMRDPTIKEEKQTRTKEDGTEEEYYEQTLKNPRGRKIKVVGGVVTEDNEYPYEDFEDRFAPYARLQNYVLPREYYGISEIEQLESPQKIFNKLVSFSLDVLTFMGNPIWVVDSTSGVDTEGLINRPGLVIEKDPGSTVRREEGVQLQPFVLQLIDRMQSWFNEVSGATDITRGVKPEGVSAASAIRTLQDASQTRLRLKSRLLDGFLQDIGQMYLSRFFQFYTAPQVFRITEDENAFRYMKVSVEEGEEGQKVVNVSEVVEDQNGITEGGVKTYKTGGKFDIVSTMGSSLPFAKEERIGLAFRLQQAGIIDAEEVLNAADYPNKEKVLMRLQQQQEQAAAMEAAQGAPQAPQV